MKHTQSSELKRVAENALEKAVDTGNINELKGLKENGLDINIILDDDRTLLMEAVRSGDINIVKELVDLGSNVNIQQPGGYTALWISAYWGLEEIFSFLAPLTLPDLYQEAKSIFPQGIIRRERRENILLDRLQTAVLSRDQESVLEIIRDGFDINTVNEDGETVLLIACGWGFSEVVKLLIDNGADVNFCSEDGSSTPLISVISGVAMLKYHTFLSDKDKYQHISVIKILLNAGANINAKIIKGENALLTAINSQSVEVVKLLLAHSVDVSAKNIRGDTALSRAKEMGSTEIIQMLINAGAIE